MSRQKQAPRISMYEPRTLPRWAGWLIVAALLALAYMVMWAPGLGADTGYRLAPGTEACWGCTPAPMLRQVCYPIDLSARPWGPTGDGRCGGGCVEAKDRRYCGGSSECRDLGMCPIGMYAEDAGFNAETLRNACLGRAEWLQPGPRDCEPTLQEQTDLQYTTSRLSWLYERWSWQQRAGGSPDRPHVVTEDAWVFHGPAVIAAGVCEEGVSFTRPLGRFGWRIHYRADWLPEDRPWCADGVEPSPPPVPEPPPPEPAPDPEPEPPCPECPPPVETGACFDLFDLEERIQARREEEREYSLARCIAALRDGTWTRSDAGRFCQVTPFWRWAILIRMEGRASELRAQCRRDLTFIPGIPSTGQTPLVLHLQWSGDAEGETFVREGEETPLRVDGVGLMFTVTEAGEGV